MSTENASTGIWAQLNKACDKLLIDSEGTNKRRQKISNDLNNNQEYIDKMIACITLLLSNILLVNVRCDEVGRASSPHKSLLNYTTLKYIAICLYH